jgi:hypothetical protein
MPRRIIPAPPPVPPGTPAPVLDVVLDEDEEVVWHWTHGPDGTRVVTGYSIFKRGERREDARPAPSKSHAVPGSSPEPADWQTELNRPLAG